MKKRIYILMLLTIGFAISCDDALDIVQDGELNEQALFTSVDNMQLLLNEVYSQFTWTENDLMISSELTDEVGVGDGGFPNDTFTFNLFTTDAQANAIWTRGYRAINRANRLIEGAVLVTPDASELADYNNIVAQARAIRAMAHFRMMAFFSPDLTDNSALGVMLLDFVPTTQQQVPRATNGELYEMIDADLDFAAANLSNPTSGADSHYFINTNTINAFRARMFLYRGDHVNAELFADRVINSSGISLASCEFTLPANFPTTTDFRGHVMQDGFNSLDTPPIALGGDPVQQALWEMDQWIATSSPAYRQMWVDQSQGEMIFSLARPNNSNNFGSEYNTNQSYILGGPLRDMGRTLFNLFEQPLGGGAQDFRRWSFVDRSSLIVPGDGSDGTQFDDVLVIDKYPGKLGSHNSNDVKYLRMSEMYFIKAECRVEANDLGGAANLIQQVRQARNYIAGATVPTPSYGNRTEAYADILLERRKELCFEGHRYFDLKRIGADAGVTTTDRATADSENGSASNPANISITDFRFTLPIPQDEININPLEQNSGYQ